MWTKMQPLRRPALLLAPCLLAAWLGTPGPLRAQVAPRYRVVNLGTLPTRQLSRATGISNTGVLCGEAWTNKVDRFGRVSSSSRAFRVSPGTDAAGNVVWFLDANGDGSNDLMRDLGTFGGDYARACAVNDAGEVVGTATNKSGSQRAFRYRGTVLTDLLGKNNSVANAITSEANPRIVGETGTTAWIWRGGSASTLPLSEARGVNAADQVVGAAGNSAVLWSGGTRFTLNAATTGHGAAAISTTGSAVLDGQLLWTPSVPNGTEGTLSSLGDLGGGPGGLVWGLNEAGQVVGGSFTAERRMHAYLWESGSGMQDLNALVDASGAGWELQAARGINAGGYIVGEGTFNGATRPFLLVPL